MPTWLRLLVTILLASLAGCSTDCTLVLVPGVRVHVHDELGQSICDAKVVAIDGEYIEEIKAQPKNKHGACPYSGANERPGTYRIEVGASGYQDESRDAIKVADAACHVITEEMTIAMTPAP